MIEVYQYLVEQINERYGEHTLELTLLVGDQTYGSATEKGAVDAISQISSDIYGISGNHDGPLIKQQAESRGITLLNGKTLTATDDLRILGAPDPTLTKLPALFGFSEDVLRNKEIGSQEELGKLLADEAKETNPTFVISHEAYALSPIIDKVDISLHSMEQWLDNGTEYANISSAAVLYGHWHRQFNYRIVRDDDGKGTIVAELGTSGGASGKMSLSSLSFPWTTPAKKASAVLFRVDTERQLVTGVQEINTRTSGEVVFQPAETIAQPREVESESKENAIENNTTSAETRSVGLRKIREG